MNKKIWAIWSIMIYSCIWSFCKAKVDVSGQSKLSHVCNVQTNCNVEIKKNRSTIYKSFPELQHNAPVENGKKTIIVFSSTGGGGHTTASKAINEFLSDKYNIIVVNLIAELLDSIDPVRKVTFNKYHVEDVYNYGLQKGWTGFLNTLIPWGMWTANNKKSHIEDLIAKYISYIKPDLVISVIPVFNGSILSAAQKRDIPLLVITTDLDGTFCINGLKNPTYDKFYYCIPFEDTDIRIKIRPAKLRKNQIKVTGYPIRSTFFEKKDLNKIRKKFNVPAKKPTLMIVMGAAGCNATHKYLLEISKSKIPMHLIVCLGRSEDLRKKIEDIDFPSNISLSVIGFTDRISDLMAVSDLLITKSGSATFCEAIWMNLPMILDATRSVLFWERLNFKFILKHRFGDVITSYIQLDDLLNKYLGNINYARSVRRKMAKFKKENFFEHIAKLVEELLNK